MKKRTIVYILGAALALIALGLLAKGAPALQVSGKYPLLSHSILVVDPGGDGESLLIRQDGRELARLKGFMGGGSQNVQYSFDHTQAAFRGLRRDPQQDIATGWLYLVDNGQLLPIAEQPSHVCLALEGDGLLYLRRSENSLCLYRGGESTVIARDLAPGIQSLRLSPDGTAAAWNYEDSACFYDGEKIVELGQGIQCDSISAQGKILYLTDSSWEHQLFVQQGGDNSTRKALGTGFFTWFNRDLTQLIYSRPEGTDDNRMYLLLEGSTKIPLGAEYLRPILPLGTQAEHSVIGVESFAGCCFSSGDFDVGICRLDDDFQMHRLLETGAASSVSLCHDGKILVYRSNEDAGLYRLDAESQSTEVLLNESVRNWQVTDNGESCYYEDQQGRLLYRQGTEPPVLLAEGYSKLYAGIRCDSAIYTVVTPGSFNQPPTAYDVYAVRKGRSRRILHVSSDYLRWRDARVEATGRNGAVLYTRSRNGEPRCYFFDEPWNYHKIRAWGR